MNKVRSLCMAFAVLALAMVVNSSSSQAQMTGHVSKAYLNNNNIPSSGLALEGYCPVAYFAVGKPVMGKKEHSSTHKGVTYHFVNADAKKMFDRHPEKYVPACGGWCAFGMAIGDKFPVDPKNFKIVNGKLLVFLKNKNIDALRLWNKGSDSTYMKKAMAHWKKVNK